MIVRKYEFVWDDIMIKTLIIMTTFGQIYYSKDAFFGATSGETDIALTAGLISAIYNMTTETQQQKITELELEELRSVFRELPGEKLFIITVDKRMDTGDADDMLGDLSESFVEKYGDQMIDGLVLNDFEPTVDKIVEQRLWYNTASKKLIPQDFASFFAILFAMFWYPYLFLSGQTTLIDPYKIAYSYGKVWLFFPRFATASDGSLNHEIGLIQNQINNLLAVIILSLIICILVLGPIISIRYWLNKYPNMSLPFRFMMEIIRRPTRGGYADVLPWWFISLPILMNIALITTIRFGRGIQYSLTGQPIKMSMETSLVSGNKFVFWYYMIFYVLIYITTWYLLLPAIIGSVVEDLSKRWLKGSWIVTSIALITFLPAQIFSGTIYMEGIGFNPNDTLFSDEILSIRFLFLVTIPINLSLFVFIFFLGVSMSQLIVKNRSRFPIAFGGGLFITLAVQNLLFFLIFRSGLLFKPLF
ncbi:MAG: hypothetical protein OEZ01_09755 [Candidatus Heimdallarchaeota archaeon]|nr:hypothetical protein [Candidatus Heimdallarchaeota archaeon]MDH5646281.1 hypothetical protein [Candidatus Heimdallarchaeota archaeon]